MEDKKRMGGEDSDLKKSLWGAKASPLKSLSGGRPGGQEKVRGNKDRMKKGSDTIT